MGETRTEEIIFPEYAYTGNYKNTNSNILISQMKLMN